jgi:autotransporter-associated beta strand protein
MRRHVVLAVAALVSACCLTAARGADVYWIAPTLGDYNNDGQVDARDYVVWRKTGINGAQGYTDWRSNFGGGPSGNWDSSTMNWTTNPTGTTGTQVWNPAGTDVAVFSAGSAATGTYTVTVDSQTASGLRDEDGDVTLSGGSLTLKTGSSINVLSGRTMTIATQLANGGGETISKNGSGTLILPSDNSSLGGEFILNSGTVGVGNANAFGVSPGSSKLTINGGNLTNSITATPTIVNLSANLTTNINGNFSVDNSLSGSLISFNTSSLAVTQGGGVQVLTGNRTITVNGPPSTSSAASGLMGLAFNNLVQSGGSFGITKTGTGTLRFEEASSFASGATAFTGDVTVQQGVLEVSSTGWIGGKPAVTPQAAGQPGGNTINLAGGNFNTSGTRATAQPINNPFVITSDAKFTQTINAPTLYGTLSETYFGGLSSPNSSKITFENTNPAVPAGTNAQPNDSCPVGGGACQIFYSRFGGTKSFNYGGNVEIRNSQTVANQLTRLSNFNTTGSTITWSGVISGDGSFTRSSTSGGTGADTVLTGANTLTGIVSVTDGTLYVNNTSGSGTGSGPVEVGSFDNQSFYNAGSKGTLAGNGSIAGPIRVWRSGFLKPGTSTSPISTLSGGSLTFSDANDGHTANEPGTTLPATYGWDLNSTLGTADLMNVNGNLSFGVSDPTFGINPGGAFAALVATDLAPTALTNGTKYTLFSYSGTWDGNTFNGLADNTGVVTIGPNQFHIDYNDTTPGVNGGSLGKYVTLTRFAPGSGSLAGGTVPEPMSAMLALVGLVPLLWRRSR